MHIHKSIYIVPDPGGPSISGPFDPLKCTVVFKYAMYVKGISVV